MVAPLARTRQDLGRRRLVGVCRAEAEVWRGGGGAAARVHVQFTVHGRPRAGGRQAADGRWQMADVSRAPSCWQRTRTRKEAIPTSTGEPVTLV